MLCSGGTGKPTSEAVTLHLHNSPSRVQRLESISTTSLSSVSSSLSSVLLPLSPLTFDSKIETFS